MTSKWSRIKRNEDGTTEIIPLKNKPVGSNWKSELDTKPRIILTEDKIKYRLKGMASIKEDFIVRFNYNDITVEKFDLDNIEEVITLKERIEDLEKEIKQLKEEIKLLK